MPRSTKSRVSDHNVLEVQLIKGARSLLGWSQADLAEHAHVSVSAVKDFERGYSSLIPATFAMLVQALKRGGVAMEVAEPAGIRFRAGYQPPPGDLKLIKQIATLTGESEIIEEKCLDVGLKK